MKSNKIYLMMSGAALLFGLAACSDYLDKQPDDRATVDSKEKVAGLLVSAYPSHLPTMMFEMASDNVADNGTQYAMQPNQDKMYRLEDNTYTGNDDPYTIWNANYTAVATANEALQAIGELGGPDAMPGEYAEALLVRAYSMFVQANIFCMSYVPDSAEVYLGLPYPTEPEQSVETKYERGTLKALYENIDRDIETALPLVNDGHLSTPKYHFNKNAAYAFAARFNLFYHNYDKAIEYANKVLGTSPAGMLRNFSALENLAGVEDIRNAYLASSVNANIMLEPTYTMAGRMFASSSYRRYAANRVIVTNETVWAPMPWGSGSSKNTLIMSRLLYGSNQAVYFPKQYEMFEYTDKVNGTGYPHAVIPVFTAEETLMTRAEAEALTNDSAAALRDMNLWVRSHCTEQVAYTSGGKRYTLLRPTLTMQSVNEFVGGKPYAVVELQSDNERSIRKTFHPQGFKVEAGNQENLLQVILQMRRVDTVHDGSRFLDLKRYGIEYQHQLDGENAITIKAGDRRMAFQLPVEAIQNGLAANPR